jgi:hypothetical protein
MKSKQNARGTIGAFLDGFWKKDPRLFLALKVQELEIEGRHALYVIMSGDNIKPPEKGTVRSYVLMTEAGLYQLTYSSQGKADFNPDDFLKNCLLIRARESAFASQVIAEYVRELPAIQATEGERLRTQPQGLQSGRPPFSDVGRGGE